MRFIAWSSALLFSGAHVTRPRQFNLSVNKSKYVLSAPLTSAALVKMFGRSTTMDADHFFIATPEHIMQHIKGMIDTVAVEFGTEDMSALQRLADGSTEQHDAEVYRKLMLMAVPNLEARVGTYEDVHA